MKKILLTFTAIVLFASLGFSADRKPATITSTGQEVAKMDCASGQYRFEMSSADSAELIFGKKGHKQTIQLTCKKPAAQPRICCDIPVIDYKCSQTRPVPDDTYSVEVTSGGFTGATQVHLSVSSIGGLHPITTLMCH